jgi:hypothetical protein
MLGLVYPKSLLSMKLEVVDLESLERYIGYPYAGE